MKNIKYIQEISSSRIREVLSILGIDFTESYGYLHAPCPVHNGDNPRGFFWHIDSNHWECKTRQCHLQDMTGPASSIFGLIRGVMSQKTGNEWSFNKSVDFITNVLNIDRCTNNNIIKDTEIDKFLSDYRRKQRQLHAHILLSDVLPSLKRDNIYYPTRDITDEIINKYHISYCNDPNALFYQRAFFPILDETGQYVVGWSGRSINGQSPKWKHSYRFKVNSYLYNYCFAKHYINRSYTAILCEGAQDVWKLEMANVHNSVALLHLGVSKQQRLLLQKAGALTLILALDNDDAGQQASERLKKELDDYFNIKIVKPKEKDIGEMSINDIKELFCEKIYC